MIKKNKLILILGFYGDMKPHKMHEQFYWLKHLSRKLNDKEFLRIHRKLFVNGLIKAFGKNYFETPLPKREHVMTNKGERMYRQLAIETGGDYDYYKNFVRK